jgi:hypothetical protein
MNNKAIAALLNDALKNGDSDAIHFAIGELEKDNETYNGWNNRETWATALHINNTQSLTNEAYDLVRKAFQDSVSEDDKESYLTAIYDAQDNLMNWVEDITSDEYWDGHTPYDIRSMRRDIGSMWRVDWREIAQSLLSDEIASFIKGEYKGYEEGEE